MKVSENSYINIQAFMVNDLRLSGNELLIFAIIFGFSHDGESWFTGSRSFLASWCQASKTTISNNLKKLCEKGLIDKRTRNENGVTLNDYRACKNIVWGYKNVAGGVQDSCTGGVQKSCPHNIEDDTSIKNTRDKKHTHGEYQNVLLTDEDLNKLQAEFPTDWHERIESLSAYMESTGKSYKNHLATIRNWAKRDNQKKEEQKNELTYDEQVGDTEEWVWPTL